MWAPSSSPCLPERPARAPRLMSPAGRALSEPKVPCRASPRSEAFWIYISIHTHIYIYGYTYICLYISTYTDIHINRYIHIYLYMSDWIRLSAQVAKKIVGVSVADIQKERAVCRQAFATLLSQRALRRATDLASLPTMGAVILMMSILERKEN